MKLSNVRWLNVAVLVLVVLGVATAFFSLSTDWHPQFPLYCILAAAVLTYLGKE